jgi:hypothetical protein
MSLSAPDLAEEIVSSCEGGSAEKVECALFEEELVRAWSGSTGQAAGRRNSPPVDAEACGKEEAKNGDRVVRTSTGGAETGVLNAVGLSAAGDLSTFPVAGGEGESACTPPPPSPGDAPVRAPVNPPLQGGDGLPAGRVIPPGRTEGSGSRPGNTGDAVDLSAFPGMSVAASRPRGRLSVDAGNDPSPIAAGPVRMRVEEDTPRAAGAERPDLRGMPADGRVDRRAAAPPAEDVPGTEYPPRVGAPPGGDEAVVAGEVSPLGAGKDTAPRLEEVVTVREAAPGKAVPAEDARLPGKEENGSVPFLQGPRRFPAETETLVEAGRRRAPVPSEENLGRSTPPRRAAEGGVEKEAVPPAGSFRATENASPLQGKPLRSWGGETPPRSISTAGGLLEKVTMVVRSLRRGEKVKAHLKLVPESLGKLEVEVEWNGGIQVRLTVHSEDAFLAVKQGLHLLKEAMLSQGVNLEGLQLGLASDGESGPPGFPGVGEPDRVPRSAREERRVRPARPARTGLLDIMV